MYQRFPFPINSSNEILFASQADDIGAVLENKDRDGTEDNGQVPLPESNPAEVVKDSIDDPKEEVQQTPATENENSFATKIEDEDRPITSEENNNASNADGQTGITALDQATISPALVKQLREETGAGMMGLQKGSIRDWRGHY
ncbi:enolase-phosphatase E isoform X1 [Spatholobus suberectus]|nr:enolase-phosphatase E isoform X1 [Spatholobus suberectus]